MKARANQCPASCAFRRKVKEWGQASSHATPERVPTLRKAAMLLALLLFAVLILFLLTLSLIASFSPQALRRQQGLS